MNTSKQISIVAALFLALALLLSAGCISPSHYSAPSLGDAAQGSGSIFNFFHHSPPPPPNKPAPTVQDGLNRWIALFWSLGAVAVVVGVLLILYTPFKSKGIWTVVIGVAAPIVMTYVAIHILKIVAVAIVCAIVWYISTHKVARIAAARELAKIQKKQL